MSGRVAKTTAGATARAAAVRAEAARAARERRAVSAPERSGDAVRTGAARDRATDGGTRTRAATTRERIAASARERDAAMRDAPAPEVAAPEVAAAEVAAPEMAALEVAAPEMAAPEVAAPEMAAQEPELTEGEAVAIERRVREDLDIAELAREGDASEAETVAEVRDEEVEAVEATSGAELDTADTTRREEVSDAAGGTPTATAEPAAHDAHVESLERAAAPRAADVAAPATTPAAASEPSRTSASPEVATGGDRSRTASANAVLTTRDRIARHGRASAGHVAAHAVRALDPLAAQVDAEVEAARVATPGEAAATRVDPETKEPQLAVDPEDAIVTTADRGSGRQRAGIRRMEPGTPGRGAGGPERPPSWPRPPRAVIRVVIPAPPPTDAASLSRPVEAHARGPPDAGKPQPTTISDDKGTTARDVTPADEVTSADLRGEGVLRLPVERIPAVQAKLAISAPGDAFEREADAVATRVMRSAPPSHREATTPAPNTPAHGGRLRRVAARERAPPPAGMPQSVASVVQTGGGSPLDPGLRARIEPHLGIDLGHVRVRREPAAAFAARDLQARAFTAGSTIYLAATSSPADVALMAHEATHVAQQDTSAVARATVMRDFELTDLIPDAILDGVRSLVRAIPGYSFLSTIVGQDLLTGEPATTSREELVEKLLTYGPFGAAVGPLLSTIDVLGDVFAVIAEGLAANNLTFARIKRDIDTAWSEFSLANGISGNAAIVKRLISALLADVASFVASIVARVIEIVRAIVAEVAEPLLETPKFKPIWDLTKKVLHYDPLRGEPVEADTVDIVADFLTLIGQEQRLAQMRDRGTLQQTADWLDEQLATFKGLIGELGGLFSEAWAAIQPENLPDLLTNLKALAGRAIGFVGRVVAFGASLIVKILELIKDSLLGWLSANAHGIPGFRLLTVILEENPFTGEPVERTAVNLIRGFITLMPSGEETYDKLAEAGVIEDAASEIETAMSVLGISVDLITGIFTGIWDTLTLDDLLDPLGAFGRVLALFGEPLSRLVEFAIVVVKVVLKLILRLMNFPGDLLGSVISTAEQAIGDIANDPVGFVCNMLAAVKLGFSNFFGGIAGYLLNGLASWLFRGLGKLGIQAPPDYSLGSIVTLVFQILGLTVEHLWTKLGEHIGPERVEMIRGAIDRLTGAWAFIVEVQRDGLSAIWRFVGDQLSGLWDTLLGLAKEWVMSRVVTAVTTKLLSLLDPTGIMAVVNSFVALFNAIQSAIEYFNDILLIVAGYVQTLAAVAAGNIGPGAQMLEQGLANAIPIAIGFLAAQVGLGNVPEKIVELVGSLRALVDKALDWLIAKAIALGKRVLDALGLGPKKPKPDEKHPAAPPSDIQAAAEAAIRADIQRMEEGGLEDAEIRAAVPRWRDEHKFKTLQVDSNPDEWLIKGQINPTVSVPVPRLGSYGNPFPLTWYKRPSIRYPKLYFGGRIGKPKSQSVLRGLHTKGNNDETGERVREYTAHTKGSLPGGADIGVDAAYRVQKGSIVGPLQAATTPGGGKINRALRPYGFVPEDEGMQGDHVREIQYGGVDDLMNLWPLDSAENGSGGSRLSKAKVTYASGTEVSVATLKANVTKYYFEITGFDY